MYRQFAENAALIDDHIEKVKKLQEVLRAHVKTLNGPHDSPRVTLNDRSGASNTTHSKAYKRASLSLDLNSLDRILTIDPIRQTATVEPRVTFDTLVHALLPYGLTVPVIPEFKEITVGGAIMGVAGESSSFRWGCFHDTCLSYELLCGDGSLMKISPSEHPDLFHGIAGSFGSLGLLLSAQIKLVPAKEFVKLRIHSFSNPFEALQWMQESATSASPPDFIDGVVFSPSLACIVIGHFQSKATLPPHLPYLSLQPRHSEWFAQHVQKIGSCTKTYEEALSFTDYAFRYDRGGFWMGSFPTQLPFLARFLSQGILGFFKDERFNEKEVKRFAPVRYPGLCKRWLASPFVTTQSLWKLLHRAEAWIRKRFVIQDFCIPEAQAAQFYREIAERPAIYPLWLCPIKGTQQPQIFAPHLFTGNEGNPNFINFGLYGVPNHRDTTEHALQHLEKLAMSLQGRKVLYSHSCYTKDEFWQIYSKNDYDPLRKKTTANGIWHSIEDKVLNS